MKHSIITALAIFGCAFTACNTGNGTDQALPTINLADNVKTEASQPLKVSDLAYVQLAGDSAEAFFKSAAILDVVGDTAVLLETENSFNASRVIMFDLKDGKYLGQINHRGQGPGEYTVIAAAFVDGADGSVLLPDINSTAVNKYMLANDSLAAVIEREPIMMRIPPSGGTESCINIAQPGPDGLNVAQYNAAFERIDSISLPGVQGGNFNMLWGNAGTTGVFVVSDTVYSVVPGALMPMAALSLGDYAVTNEKDQELFMKMMTSGESEIDILKPYIIVRDVQFAGDNMLLTTMHNGVKHSDFYNLNDGSLIYRSTYDQLSKPSSIMVETADGKIVEVTNLFGKDGNWYGIVSDTDADAADDNCAIVKFTIGE